MGAKKHAEGENMEGKKYYLTPEIDLDLFEEKDVLSFSGEAGELVGEQNVFSTGNEYGNFWW